ncbi:hypothetical protein SMD22_01290 (plasmid) [Brevibacillus halotolerans]|nr:hypothetical protein SMD22_01290 [Brevibacillus halotolerans]
MSNLARVRKFTEILKVKKGALHGVEEVAIKDISNGKIETRKVLNGIWYQENTPYELLPILDGLYRSGTRCRFYFGDIDTGYDWGCQNYILGTISISTGEINAPLLISSKRGYSGCALLTGSIVKIVASKGGQVLWKHPNYQKPEFEIINRGEEGFPKLSEEYEAAVFRINDEDGRKNYANFNNRKKAEGYVAFMTGERNSRR